MRMDVTHVTHRQRVVATVVTRNRRELLAEALAAVHAQTRAPEDLVVVDNASSDGTAEYVREHFPTASLVSLARNMGGAGGFAAGLAQALGQRSDLVWLMDDDTIPEPGTLQALLDARERYPGAQPPALVASRVTWTDGRNHPLNTPRRKPGVSREEADAAAAAGCVPTRSASFVSVLVDARAVREVGLPVADYFLWNDDFEFTTRLLRGRVGLFCPGSVVVHKTATFGDSGADPGERFFYEVRNKVWLFTRSPGLRPLERLLYGLSTCRRWARTAARSRDRVTLGRALGRGLRAGVGTRPRATEAVLADAAASASEPGSGTSATGPAAQASTGADQPAESSRREEKS